MSDPSILHFGFGGRAFSFSASHCFKAASTICVNVGCNGCRSLYASICSMVVVFSRKLIWSVLAPESFLAMTAKITGEVSTLIGKNAFWYTNTCNAIRC